MICPPCKLAGEMLQAGCVTEQVAMQHLGCRGGTWCDCQHSTDPKAVRLVPLPAKGVG